jgi:hypothetical protein
MHKIYQAKSHLHHQAKYVYGIGAISALLVGFSVVALAETTPTGSIGKNIPIPAMTRGTTTTVLKQPSSKAPLSTINNPNHVKTKELSPDTIQTIQHIGRSVLDAKHSEVMDPNIVQVKSRLQNLRQNLDDVIKVEQTPLYSASTTYNTENQSTSKQSNPQRDIEMRKHEKDVEQKTSTLKQHLGDIKLDNQQRRQALSDHPENDHQPHMRQLLDKSQSISDEIDTALADKSPERMAKLMQLRERLNVKSLGDMQRDIQPAKTTAEETPTISTITRHRE